MQLLGMAKFPIWIFYAPGIKIYSRTQYIPKMPGIFPEKYIPSKFPIFPSIFPKFREFSLKQPQSLIQIQYKFFLYIKWTK
jgi:hypothetical protein